MLQDIWCIFIQLVIRNNWKTKCCAKLAQKYIKMVRIQQAIQAGGQPQKGYKMLVLRLS